jgi:hypothetical protein
MHEADTVWTPVCKLGDVGQKSAQKKHIFVLECRWHCTVACVRVEPMQTTWY